MSSDRRADLARGWQRAVKLIDEEGERLASLSDEEFERAMEEQPDVGADDSRDGAALRGEPASESDTTKDIASRRRAPAWVWPVAACVALVALVAAGMVERPEIAAWWHRGQITPDKEQDRRESPQDQPTREQLAAAELREQAFVACDEGGWEACVGKLDQAKALDPAGDTDPRVQAARATADEGIKRDSRYQQPKKKTLEPPGPSKRP